MSGKNIWYCYTAPCTGAATVSLCGSSFDTKVAVYDRCGSIPTLGNMLQCNDDSCGRQSEATFDVYSGQQYLIEVGGYNILEFGSGVLNISCDDNPGYRPSNDDWHSARSVSSLHGLDVDTTHATMDGPGDCVENPNIWYRYTASSTGEVTITLDGSGFDIELAIYEDDNIFPRWENRIVCENIRGQQPQITFDAIAGQDYLIEIGGEADDHFPPFPPPSESNDDCYNAKLIGNVTDLTFDTSNATYDGPGHCMTSPNIWYIYNATCTGEATVSLCGSSYDTKLAVYNGGGCNPSFSRLIECNDDSCGWQSEVTFDVFAGQQYLIEVGGFGDNTGQGLISISCEGTAPALIEPDLGDAPDSTNNFWLNMTAYPKGGPSGIKAHYPTVYNDGMAAGPVGPIHSSSLAVAHLGKIVSNEDEADMGPDEDDLNNIKPQTDSPDNDKGDDGVIFPLNMPQFDWTTFDYNVNVIKPGMNLWVNVWCDWNRDGDWDDEVAVDDDVIIMIYPPPPRKFVPEWAVQNQYLINLPAGLNQMTTPAFLSLHPDNASGEIWMRITLSEQPWTGGSAPGSRGNGGSGPKDGYGTGETEDYYFLPGESF
jgi:hypothetical protein